jgi:hypothetical protein
MKRISRRPGNKGINADADIDWRGGYDDTNHRIQRGVRHLQESELQRLGTPALRRLLLPSLHVD